MRLMRKIRRLSALIATPTLDGSPPNCRRRLERLTRAVQWECIRQVARWREVTITCEQLGFSMTIPVGTGISTSLYILRDELEKEVSFLLYCLRPDMTFLDIGANFGFYSLLAARRGCRVIAVEPHPTTAKYLLQNLRANGVKDVHVIQKALSDTSGTATLYEPHFDPFGSSSLLWREALSRALSVQMVTLDEAIPEDEHIDMIKLDVEGAEGRVLRGGKSLLQRDRPSILLELSTAGFEACSLLTEHGYRFFTWNGKVLVSISPIALWKVVRRCRAVNVIALSSDGWE